MGVPVTIEDNRYANAPIPSYDEAISQPSRSGPSEISDDAERQGLLGQSSFHRLGLLAGSALLLAALTRHSGWQGLPGL